MDYNMKKAKLMAKISMSSQKRPLQLDTVDTMKKPVLKAPKKSAPHLAKIKGLKKKKMKLPKVEVKLPKAPASTSTARRLQDPRHSDMMRGLINVPSLQDMGLRKEGEAQSFYGKMLVVTTRGLTANTGSLYYRSCVQTGYRCTAGIG